MGNKIFFEGDLQLLKSKSEYNNDSAKFNAQKAYIRWVLSNPKLNNEKVYYFSLGDFFENALPTPEEMDLGLFYLSNGKWKHKFILGGNHGYSRLKESHSTLPFSKLPETTLIFKPLEIGIEGLKINCLPYYYDNIYSDLPPMKEYYESLEGSYDIIVTHIQDTTQEFGDKKSIDITKLNGELIQGHIHAVRDNISGYVNSPIACTKAEVLEKRYCFLYDIDTKTIEKIEIPNFLNYKEIVYPEPIKETQVHDYYTLYTIKDYTDKQTAIDFYRKTVPDLYIKEMIRKKLQDVSKDYTSIVKKSVKDFFNDYVEENKVAKEVQSIVYEKLPIS